MNKLAKKIFKLAAVAAPAIVPALTTSVAKADPVTFSTLTSFDTNYGTNAIGSAPEEGVSYDPYTNSLVGTTTDGSQNGFGSIYQVDPTTGTKKILAPFSYPTTGVEIDSPILATPSGYYFNSAAGGLYGPGALTFMPHNGSILTANYNSGASGPGGSPYGGPALGGDGKIYTLTREFGGYDYGALSTVSFTGGVGTFTQVQTSDGSETNAPLAGLTAHGDSLYWVTPTGGREGTVSVYNTTDHTLKMPITFDSGIDPIGTPQFDAAGNMYVTALDLSVSPIQTDFYKLAPGATTAQEIFTLSGTPDGTNFQDPFLLDPAGDQFFLFKAGSAGQYNFDELSADGVLTTTLLPTSISNPDPLLTYDPNNGLIYGATQTGGSNNLGTIFTIANSGYQSVPEPTGAALVGIAALGLLGRRRRESSPALSM